MPRFAHQLVTLLVLASLLAPATVAAQATPTARTPTLDLAAMTLSPNDLAALGITGYGRANASSLRDAETDALVQADGDAIAAARRLALYDQVGFQSRYLGSLLRPRLPLEFYPSGLVAAESRISTSITEFATAGGAETAFLVNENELDDTPGRDVPGTVPFGDGSELTRSTGTETESGSPLQRLELSFRLDNLIAEVTIVDYQNIEPAVATAEQLAGRLLAKIELVRSDVAPNLSARVLRLTPMAPWIEAARLRDFYTRQASTREPTFAEIVAAAGDRGQFAAGTPVSDELPTLPIDTYMFWTPIGDGDPLALPLYVVWLNRFASPEQAAAAISRMTPELGPGYADVHEFFAEPTIGDDSRGFVYNYVGDPTAPVSGHLIVSRVGNIVINVQVDSPTGVQRSGVRELAAAQVACLEVATGCAPLASLAVLASLVPNPVVQD